MPRSNREETKEKNAPFKKCAEPNCNNRCEFYDSVKKASFCRKCKLNFFCFNEAIKIIDSQEVKDTIQFVSKILEAMNNHAKVHKIDFVYNGFSDDLHVYEERLLNITKKIKDAIESTLIEKYADINKEAIDLKKELDLSELMHNFLKHRFQIALNQSLENSSEYSVENEIHYNELLIESKKKVMEYCEHEYNVKLEKEKEIIDTKYRSKLDKLTNKVKEYATIVENKNEEIKISTSNIIELEKENKNLKEVIKFYLECHLDVYHLKTGTEKSDKIEDTDFRLYLDDEDHSEVLANMKLLKLPDIKRVYLDEIPKTYDDLLHFLKHSAPNKTEIFVFRYNGGIFSTKIAKIDYYLDGLETALKEVTKKIYIGCWSCSKQSLERVFKASCNSSRLIISCSKLDCDSDFDFSGPEYKTTYLSFCVCGVNHGDNWSANPEKLGRIIKAISLCSMKESLQTLNVYRCGVSVQKTKEMLSTHGMANVNVVEDGSDSSPSSD